jgi:hypothetical protein
MPERDDLPELGETTETTTARPPSTPGVGRRVTLVSLRIVRGLVGTAAAAVVVAAVGLVPLTTLGVEPLGTLVEPAPADLLMACPGALLRLGDDTGANAGQVFPVGRADVTVASHPSGVEQTPLTGGDAAGSAGGQAPSALRLAASDDATLTAAQQQAADGAGDLRGLAATGCVEAGSSAWFVGGATTVGRTAILQLVNPTAVDADVTLELWGESGPVSAPGMSGITVPAGGRIALPLSGFAPDLVSPVVHVEARGGQVAGWLQTSVVRVLDAGGVDLVSTGTAPAREAVIPGVRLFDTTGVASSLGIDGFDDLEAVVRLGNPGDAPAHVEVSLALAATGGVTSSFEVTVDPGVVGDTPLASALELGADPLPDGEYLVSVRSDEPIVAGVRTSTIPVPTTDAEGGLVASTADLAWFASASPLDADAVLAVADAADPVLVAVATDGEPHTLRLEPIAGGEPIAVAVPASGPVAVPLDADTGYRIRDAGGVAAALSFAAAGQLAGYPLSSPRASDSPLLVRP